MMETINITNLPKSPGCYLFKDENEKVIYIGKAGNIRKRVRSYFTKKDLDAKTSSMLQKIHSVDFIATSNEIEALILENNLIKKHLPRYNINLKDSKRYAAIEVTGEEFPRFIISRRPHSTTKKGKLFGPFISAQARDEIWDFLTKTFGVRTCRRIPKKACLKYHLQICSAPCIGKISNEDYQKNIMQAESILNGKIKELTDQLDEDMKTASKLKDYEIALRSRKIIDALKWLNEKQNMERNKLYDEDIINYAIKGDTVYLLLFNISKGILDKKQEFIFEGKDDFLEGFLVQYYSENPVPKEVILPLQVDKAIEDFLSEKRGSKASVVVPKHGDKKQLLCLVSKNIELSFFSGEKKLDELKEALHLEKTPLVIECFDISHISGTSMVASMVQFRNANPSKDNYRRFKIKSLHGIDDCSAIAEVVRRRYTRQINEKMQLPDLVIIDGGIGQLNAAGKEISKLNLKIPLISIAKEFEEVYTSGISMPLPIGKKSQALQLIRRIRDEAHRFAVSYNRLLRKKQLVGKND